MSLYCNCEYINNMYVNVNIYINVFTLLLMYKNTYIYIGNSI